MEWTITSTENFGGKSLEIGWLEYSHCKEGNSGDSASIYNPDYSMDELLDLAQYAVTIKFLPSTDVPGQSETASYAVMAELCSNPIYALNRGYTMSWTVDETSQPPVVTGLATTDNWIGATELMSSVCYGDDSLGAEPTRIEVGYVYHACGNHGGLHIRQPGASGRPPNDLCYFDYGTNVGHDITVWFGFDAQGDRQ